MPQPATPSLPRRLLAEAVGTALLVSVVVGSGIAAARLSPQDVGLQLLENSVATALALVVLILLMGPVSGAHFNPVVSALDWALSRRGGAGLSGGELGLYVAVQAVGAIGGAMLANAMFGLAPVQVSGHARVGGHLLLGEVVATGGLVALVVALARSRRGSLAAPLVACWIGSAYWFTSSTSFANPAVTLGRVFSDTFAGIAPGSVPAFVLAQVAGAALGLGLAVALYPAAMPAEADGHRGDRAGHGAVAGADHAPPPDPIVVPHPASA
ncbi:MAG: aquaporin [Kineosporiaceae bacterium]